MPYLLRRPCGSKIYYDIKGSHHGIPVLLLAPGGMRSSIAKWEMQPYNPWKALPESKFRLIGMDQRFAPSSSTEEEVQQRPPQKTDGWHTFLEDQVALLDHLNISKCHLIGSCIGPSYAFQLMREAPTRFGRCVMLQPIGLTNHTTEPGTPWIGLNQHATSLWFGDWASEMVQSGKINPGVLQQLHDNMFGRDRDFVFSITRQEAAKIKNPLLVFMGRDIYHPSETSREIARICPNAELVEEWRDVGAERLVEASAKIEAFLDIKDFS